jgi:vitamin B12 transporter
MKNLSFAFVYAFLINLFFNPSVYSLDQENIIVTSSRIPETRKEIGTAVTVLTQEDIEAKGYSSVADLLRTTPSIGVSNAGGQGTPTALRVRGEEGYRTLVMLDGVDLSDPTGTQVGPQIQHMLLNGDIERIEILRGSQGFIYGADAGGVINMFTPQGEGSLAAQLKLEGGRYDTQKAVANVSGGNKTTDFFIAASDFSTDGFNSRKDDTSNDSDGYDNTALHAKLGFQPAENSRLQLVIRDIDSENEYDNCGIFDSTTFVFTPSNDCRNLFEQSTAKLSFEYINDLSAQNFSYANTKINRESISISTVTFATDGETNKAEYWGSVKFNGSTVVYGLDIEEEDVLTNSGKNLDREQLGIYAEYKVQFDKKLYLNLGVRQDDNDDFGKHISKRVSMSYIQGSNKDKILKYRASYGTGFRAPSLAEVAYNNSAAAFAPASDTELKEEKSNGYDVGIDFEMTQGILLQATYFNQTIEDEIYFDLSGFSGYLQSTGETESKGIEVSAEIPFGQQWNIVTNYTYNDTENLDGLQRVRRPKHLANLGVQYVSTDEALMTLVNVRTAKDSEDEIFEVGRVDLEDYTVVDLSAVYKINKKIKINATIQNLFDEEYEEITGYNVAGMAASVGVKFSL